MCGRFLLVTPLSELVRLFGFDASGDLPPRYNIAPSQTVAAVREEEGARRLVLLRWGLIPAWAGDETLGGKLFNARAETAAEKPAFRGPFRSRRCLVPADGFYEWRSKGRSARQPYAIRRRDRVPMALAALWDQWRDLETLTILTVAANATMAPLHDRMPAILAAEDWAAWLDPATQGEAAGGLLRPAPDDLLDAVPVGPRVNSVRNDGPACLDPPSDAQPSLF
jgi:putative SOS response-associated peptidase YedK